MDCSKYVRYTPEQVEALERVYGECPKPSSLRRQQLVREFPILSNIEPKQIKVWFQNRRCREKQRKESSRLQTVNRKLTAMNKLLTEENDRLQKQVSTLVYDNGYMRNQLQTSSVPTTDNSCESVVLTIQQQSRNPTHQQSLVDASSPAGLLAIAQETMTEFLAKATGTAVDWVQMIGMKPGPDSIGIIAVSRNCTGIAARACGLVNLEPAKVASILKDRATWYRDCRCMQILSVLPTANKGTIEIIYMQTYAPTILAAARDFLYLRYTTTLEDGSLLLCERSLPSSTLCPHSSSFVRAQILPSGYLIRPCEGNGSILHIVDHVDLNPTSVPEIMRPLYESSKFLAQKTTMAAFRHVTQIAKEAAGEVPLGGRQPSLFRTFSQRLSKGFNDTVNGFPDDGWSTLESDGVEDVTISVNAGVLCAKASMLLKNVHPAILVRFLREHRSEWADSPFHKDDVHVSGHVFLPLSQTTEHEEFLEVVKLQAGSFSPVEASTGRNMYLLQLCSGVNESVDEGCAQMIFAPIDDTFADDAPLLPSGFCIIPLDIKDNSGATTTTLDLASVLDDGPGFETYKQRSVLTIAFQFLYEAHFRDNVAAMARQYIRSVVTSVQRVATAIAPSRSLPEASTLARWIYRSYRQWYGRDMFGVDADRHLGDDGVLKMVWHHSDAIMCCSLKNNAPPAFTFANQTGLDMLETSLVALQDIMLEKILDEAARQVLCSVFSKFLNQGFACLPCGICASSMGRPVAYEKAIAWKVLNDENAADCLALMFVNWAFV